MKKYVALGASALALALALPTVAGATTAHRFECCGSENVPTHYAKGQKNSVNNNGHSNQGHGHGNSGHGHGRGH